MPAHHAVILRYQKLWTENKMTNNKKDIPVNFVAYEPYSEQPDVIANLGYISFTELKKIMNAFSTEKAKLNACIYCLSAEYNDTVRFGRTAWHQRRYNSLDLSQMFWLDNNPQCGNITRQLNEIAKIKHCARNLKNGKCCDEFIRNTLGTILFPQHYAKEKQK